MRVEVPSGLDGERVDRAVAMITGLSRSEVTKLVDEGAVRLGGEVVAARTRKVSTDDVLEVDLPDPDAAARRRIPSGDPEVGFEVVHVDDHVLVVDKPAGLVVHPGAGVSSGTLVHGLLDRHPELAGVGQVERPGIVHRLDVGTSGLMVVARTAEAYDDLVAALAAREVERTYLALVWGHPSSTRGVIDAPIGRSPRDRTRMAIVRDGRPARTHFHVDETHDEPLETAVVTCRLETGRTHQIRVHLASIGHPVVGDDRYRGAKPAVPLDRPFLHARALAFHHPVSGEWLEFTSELPADLRTVLDGLR